jgi:hypothetical protein
MNAEQITSKFAKMGAQVDVAVRRRVQIPWDAWKLLSKERVRRLRNVPERFSIDVDERGRVERFIVAVNRDVEQEIEVSVLDVQPVAKHLLLMVKDAASPKLKQKFLCGHDERHWFVAAVPEAAHTATVRDAQEALKPADVRASQVRAGVKTKARNRRRNAGFVRQGEWFFIPAPDLHVKDLLALRNEPLRRGLGKPHFAEFLFRQGGVSVHVCPQFPNGLTDHEYGELIRREPEKRHLRWQVMRRNPEVYVKGRIRHPDHKTTVLPGWHRVVPNTENRAAAGRNVAFLD